MSKLSRATPHVMASPATNFVTFSIPKRSMAQISPAKPSASSKQKSGELFGEYRTHRLVLETCSTGDFVEFVYLFDSAKPRLSRPGSKRRSGSTPESPGCPRGLEFAERTASAFMLRSRRVDLSQPRSKNITSRSKKGRR